MNGAPLKNLTKRGGFADKPVFRVIRGVFPAFARIAPSAAAAISLRLFLTPQRHNTPAWERPYLADAKVETLESYGKKFQAYVWGSGSQTIVMCHSWGGRGTQLAEFIPALRSKGFRVVAFDAPAHGRSAGRKTDMMEYSTAVNAVAANFGPIYGLLGHSFGAGNAFLSWSRFQFSVERIALIGCFSNAVWVTERFGEVLGIPGKTISAMRKKLEDRYAGELHWNALVIGDIAKRFRGDLLVVHDKEDQEIPYFHAQRLIESSGRPSDCLYTTEGLGHRRILRNQGVIDKVTSFFGVAA